MVRAAVITAHSGGGELIAAWVDNAPLPVPRDVAEACHPNRFMLRELIRGKGKQG